MASKESPTESPTSTALETETSTSIPMPEDSATAEMSNASWKSLFAFTRWSHAWPLVAAVVATGFTAALKTALAVVLGETFNVTTGFGTGMNDASETMKQISKWSIVLLGLGIGNWIANGAFLALWIMFGELQADSVRRELFDNLLRRDMSWYDSQENGVSSLLIQIQTQTRELQLADSQLLGLLLSDLLTALGSLGIALYYTWKLTLVLLATLPISAIILSWVSKPLQPAIVAQKHDLATASKHATASTTAIDLVKVFNSYDQESRTYSEAVQLAAKQYLIQARCNSLQMGYVAFWVVGMFVVGFTYGVELVNEGLQAGNVMTTFYATLAAFQGIEALVPHWLVLAKGMSAGAFLSSLRNEVKSSDAGEDDTTAKVRPEGCHGHVELRNVSFAYPSNPTRTVLNESSFSFPAGEITFIVGRSGSGKSTVGNIIADFYQPSTGVVHFDGLSAQILDKDWIRANVILIQQTSILFNETFFQNVAFGYPDPEHVPRDQVVMACESALLQSTVAGLPQGLETLIGPEGHNLSGGQKQRLALARARLRDPKVLILDEVTSGLDQVSRVLIMDAIKRWRKGKTTIIITHDVSHINDDDFVYVMDNSWLVQQGRKSQLLRDKNGHFASLAALRIDTAMDGSSVDDASSIGSPSTDMTSAIEELPLGRFTRLSQRVINEVDKTILRSHSQRMTQRASIGVGVAQAMRLMADQMWEEKVEVEQKRQDLEPLPEPEVNEMRKRFSRYVESHFTSPEEFKLFDKEKSFGMLKSSNVSEARAGDEESEKSSEVPHFIFGEADRRENISSLRLVQRDEPAYELEEVGEPASEQKKRKIPGSLFATLRSVWPTLGPKDRIIFCLGLLVCAIGSAATPAFSYCFAQLLGAFWAPENQLQVGMKWSLALVGIAIGDALTAGGGRYLMEMAAQAWVNQVRMEAINRILRQPKAWFDRSSNSPGRINECLDRNAEEMRNIVGRFIPISINVFGMILIAVVWALVVSWRLTLVVLAPLPLLVGAVKIYSVFSGKWETICNKGAEDASAILTEILLKIRVVRALTLEKYFGKKYSEIATSTYGLGLKRAAYTSPLFGLYQSLSYPLAALVFYYGVLLMTQRSISPVEMMQVVNLLLFCMGTAAQVLSTIPQITLAQATAAQMLSYAALPMQPPDDYQGTRKTETPLPVKMRGLRFSYARRSREQVLRGVSLDIVADQCLAIVGNSGGGKSTIVSLLLGLYLPSPSTTPGMCPLSFGGVPYTDLDIQHLRTKMAYVSQSPFLFPATIAENIAYGLPETSSQRGEEWICRAAMAAGIHDFIISLPQGYNTIVGEGGQALSGGQAQRVSIARALVRQPKILVLDEPTSALDAESADMIRHTIRDLVKGRGRRKSRSDMAIVLVTHSREMMRDADKIVLLEDGLKVEEGTYESLVAAGGPFAYLVSGGERGDRDRRLRQSQLREKDRESMRIGSSSRGAVGEDDGGMI